MYFSAAQVDWHTARANCRSRGGNTDLIIIANAAEHAVVMLSLGEKL